MKTTIKLGFVLMLVGLSVLLSFPGLAGAGGGGTNIVREFDCTISLLEIEGGSVVTDDTRSVETSSGNVVVTCRADLPNDLAPPVRAVRTTGDLCMTTKGLTSNTAKVITPAGKVRLTCHVNGKDQPPISGWAIGHDETGTAAIAHTSNGGLTWQEQGDSSAWAGLDGNDISAVDDQTAWAALGSGPAETSGAILFTTDGGATWISQPYPSGIAGGIKSIKGLSRDEAWAASLGGEILHTTDGGNTWNIIPHPTIRITAVNRMDAMGSSVWIADSANDGAVVHTKDGGSTWRAEYLPNDDSPLTVHAFNPLAVWVSGSILPDKNPTFYRTGDGGDHWDLVKHVGGNDHLDDICAASPDDIWGALNGGAVNGKIWRMHVEADGTPVAIDVTPPEVQGYTPGGVTCLDADVAWVVADRGQLTDPAKPMGIIVHTTDGGESWVQQSAPTDIHFWKISFAGARR